MDGRAILEVRRSYIDGGKIGSVPHPPTLRGLGKALVEMLKGAHAPALMDRMSERLCSERSAVRLYEGLIAKHEATESWPGGPTRQDLEILREEELQNFQDLHRQTKALGADPTALGPSADVAGVAMSGIFDVMADPRTDLRQCVEAMLVAELADHAYWESLCHLAEHMGHEELAAGFHCVLAVEARHVSLMRSWALLGWQAGTGPRVMGERAWRPVKVNGRRRRPAGRKAQRGQRARR